MNLTDLVPREQLLEGLHEQEIFDYIENGFCTYSLDMKEFSLAVLLPAHISCESIVQTSENVDAMHRGESYIRISEWVRFGEFLVHLDYFNEGEYYEICMPDLTTDTEDAFLDNILNSITVYPISDMHLVLSKFKTFSDMVNVVKNVAGDNWKSVLHNYIDSI